MKHELSGALAQLVSQYALTARQQEQLVEILRCVASDERAPTTVTEPQLAVDIHLADSLVALELDVVRMAQAIADIGAGAGFPGLPLAVALPTAEVVLVDGQARKCTFIERVREVAQVENAHALCARVEEWPEGVGAHDVVVARAVGPQPVVIEYAAPLLKLGGALVDWRGSRNQAEEQAAASAAEQLGLGLAEVRRVEPFAGVRGHHLHVYVKQRETPDRFPRRVGMAHKRPLARARGGL